MQMKFFIFSALLLFVLSVLSYQRGIILEYKNKLLECENKSVSLESKINTQNIHIKKLLETQEANLKLLELQKSNFDNFKNNIREQYKLPKTTTCSNTVKELKLKSSQIDYLK